MQEGNVASSVVTRATGAIAINASRIVPSHGEPDSGAMFYKNRGLPMPENRTNYFGGEDRVATSVPIDGGRWPANLVLEHLPGCQQVGVGGLTGSGGRKAEDKGSERHDGREAYRLRPGVQVAPRGREGECLASWECVVGCPVMALDESSGVLQHRGNKNPAFSDGVGSGHTVSLGPPVPSAHHARPELHVDGGASRFFKQVQER